MAHYALTVALKNYKENEFITFMKSVSYEIRKEEGCTGFQIYRCRNNDCTFKIVAEWQSRKKMEHHFKGQNYKLIMGSSKVLGESCEINISESIEKDELIAVD